MQQGDPIDRKFCRCHNTPTDADKRTGKYDMDEGLRIKIRNAPKTPGVYLMKDTKGDILYVGKSKDLKSRVHAYFSRTDGRFMIPFLVGRINDIDFIITKTEKEALLLENELIKKHRPRYNVELRDDKAYYHLRIDRDAAFPMFQLVRKPVKDGAFYFGPYPSSAAAKETMRFLQSVFPLRTCRDNELRNRTRPCVEYQIRRCCGPCVGLVDEKSYTRLVQESVNFLEGREKMLLRDLNRKMQRAAEALDFEEASVLRDRIAAVQKTIERQAIASSVAKDQDVWGIHEGDGRTHVCILLVRGGKVLGKRALSMNTVPMPSEEVCSALIRQYYDCKSEVPEWILIPGRLEDQDIIEQWLSEKKGHTVKLCVPRRGIRRNLMNMARENAGLIARTDTGGMDDPLQQLGILKEVFNLSKLPQRIECFDISHIGGSHPVAAMVTFCNGKPCKRDYRRFRLRSAEGIDDYAMMHEVLTRRYVKAGPRPELLVVDGGKGQLGVALSVLKDLGIRDQEVIGIAKKKNELGTKGLRKEEDRFYLPGRKDPVYLSGKPFVLGIMQHLRDEAHRFAVGFSRQRKNKEDFRSKLDDIRGIGRKRKKALLKALGSLENVKDAMIETLSRIEGIGRKRAELILEHLQSDG